MKKRILFIAEYNDVLKDLFQTLETYFDVQMCIPKNEAIKKSFKVYANADAILVNVGGIKNEDLKETEDALGINVTTNIPVIVIGLPEECDTFISNVSSVSKRARAFINGSIFIQGMHRPLSNKEIVQRLGKIVGVKEEELPQISDIEENGPRKVLMIDDDAMMIRAIAKLLAPKYKVIAATSGAAGLAMMESASPDAVLLDYEMPGFNGAQILEMTRKNDIIKDIPVYFLTGKDDSETVMKLIALKPAGYFLKSSNPEEIIKALDKHFVENKNGE